MKIAVCFLFLLASQIAGSAADTAYTALRTLGKQKGAEALNHVAEVRGRNGSPQPETWKITLEEPSARGGLRELEIQHSRIVGERTPTSRPLERAMNFSQLNLDSDGVFTIVNEQMNKSGVMFDHADYLLQSGSGGAAPVWHVELFEGRRGRVASFSIAADSGAILKRDLGAAPMGPIAEETHPIPQGPGPSPHDSYEGTDIIDEDHPIKDFNDFLSHVKHHFEKRGRQIENFFTWVGRTASQ